MGTVRLGHAQLRSFKHAEDLTWGMTPLLVHWAVWAGLLVPGQSSSVKESLSQGLPLQFVILKTRAVARIMVIVETAFCFQ